MHSEGLQPHSHPAIPPKGLSRVHSCCQMHPCTHGCAADAASLLVLTLHERRWRVGAFADAYAVRLRGVDRTGNVGPTLYYQWSAGPCPAASTLGSVSSLQLLPVDYGEKVLTWAFTPGYLPTDVNGNPIGTLSSGAFEYTLDGGAWTATNVTLLQFTNLTVGMSHSFTVRVVVPSGCAGVIPASTPLSVSWFETGAVPGTLAFASTPSPVSSSVFGDFVVQSTSAQSWLQYTLDGSSWTWCESAVRLGPLVPASHTVAFREVNATGSPYGDVYSPYQLQYAWTVVSASNSTLTLTVNDGMHTVKVQAVDSISQEPSPQTFVWTVDTVPPDTLLRLTSPTYSNGSSLALITNCTGACG